MASDREALIKHADELLDAYDTLLPSEKMARPGYFHVAVALVRQLRAALAAPPSAQEGWQPIATAPLAELVLLRGGLWRHPWVGMVNGDHGACWLDGFNLPDSGWQAYATHWMPLPPPPAGAPRT